MKTVHAWLMVNVEFEVSDDTTIGDIDTIMNEFDYSFSDTTGSAKKLKTMITDMDITKIEESK